MKKRIVIAEDDLDILFTLNMMLENAGYEVNLSSNGKFILEGKYDYPDLYILDKRISDIDRLEVCPGLRRNPEPRNIPIIIISASTPITPAQTISWRSRSRCRRSRRWLKNIPARTRPPFPLSLATVMYLFEALCRH
jgi:CheY-like chemotaxis protein